MDSFEFLSVLISVVVGLGVANILTGIGRLLHRHREVQVSATFIMWSLYLFNYMVIYWWTVVYGWQEWQNWNLLIFMFILVYGILLYLLAVILYPTDMAPSWDPHSSFIDMRRWFFGIFIALVFIEALDSILKDHVDDFSTPYYLLLGLWLSGGVLGWVSSDRRTHTAISACILASQIGWVAYQLRDLTWSISTLN
jgi:hypothetical protein